MTSPLTDKQARFCEEYLIDSCASKAAIRAGYSEKSAWRIGHQLLSKPQVTERIKLLQQERSKRTGLTADWVVGKLRTVVERCLQEEPVRDRKGEQVQIETPDGLIVGAFTFDSTGANRALELLGKHLGVFNDKGGSDPVINVVVRRFSDAA